MSMTTWVILQFVGIFAAYTGLTVLLPAVMFRRVLRGRRLSEQFLMCYTFGNFYIINIVFAVQLLHISNFQTLVLLTVVLSVLIWSRVNRISLRKLIIKNAEACRKLLQGSMGIKGALYRVWQKFIRMLKYAICFFYREVVCNTLQWILAGAIVAALFWVYGRQLILTYGYRVSDIPVHLDWINQMSRGKLFTRGVYPFGFHCMIYYLHTVFRVDTYVILCVFYLVQVFFIHMILLAMLKMLCSSKYLPYAGILMYILGSFWARNTYFRFGSSLPQEFGMIFVIPSIYFLIRFFQTEKENLKTKETKLTLSCFACAFSLTLAIHFYGTMIAGMCCIGIAAGYVFRFLNKEYFRRIMVTGIISVFLAVLPMAIAFAGGTPLQGSLGWGLSVINGGNSDNEEEENTVTQDMTIEEIAANLQGASESKENTGTASVQSGKNTPTVTETPKPSLGEKVGEIPGKIKDTWNMMAQRLREFIINLPEKWCAYAVLTGIGVLILLGLVFIIFRRTAYGEMLMSAGFCMGILTLLLCAGNLGLPVLMDPARCSIYYAYLLVATLTLLGDGILYLIFMPRILKVIRNAAALGLTVITVAGMIHQNLIKTPDFLSGYVSNGALTCLTNIIRENEDKTWTIVSANDETQMGLDHGWHYETIAFLRKLEKMDKDTKVIIPTKNVYFFIEKIPLDYSVVYSGSGQSISKKGASQSLPNVGGISMYQGEGRWILMSRMYYWAQAFMEKYPNDMKVYYESEDFICYVMPQNMYHQYNFAIDYGYNQVQTQEAINS
ncbi:hypothetical protein [Blautia luti]|uniref:hypothetical protein n=1 Tax=Blautia TaxID=572511 RepID=UPI001FA9D9B4|nr:hypothetical protein [Blautia luti]